MFIEHSLKSIINQSFKNFEIIIVDTYFNKDRKKLIYQQFKKNKNKINYLYILTPKGINEKTKLTFNFMKRKLNEYDELKKEIK